MTVKTKDSIVTVLRESLYEQGTIIEMLSSSASS